MVDDEDEDWQHVWTVNSCVAMESMSKNQEYIVNDENSILHAL